MASRAYRYTARLTGCWSCGSPKQRSSFAPRPLYLDIVFAEVKVTLRLPQLLPLPRAIRG